MDPIEGTCGCTDPLYPTPSSTASLALPGRPPAPQVCISFSASLFRRTYKSFWANTLLLNLFLWAMGKCNSSLLSPKRMYNSHSKVKFPEQGAKLWLSTWTEWQTWDYHCHIKRIHLGPSANYSGSNWAYMHVQWDSWLQLALMVFGGSMQLNKPDWS